MELTVAHALQLRSGAYTATVVPEAGGRIASFEWLGGGSPLPLLVGWDGTRFDEHDWPKAGAFPMLPFANRLPPEGFSFRGRSVRPCHGPGGFALHGSAHRRTWTCIDASDRRVVMALSHDGTGDGWPWAWSARQVVQLDDDGLSVDLTVTNAASDTMPLSMGWHPYVSVPGHARHKALQFAAATRHALDPDGRALPATPALGRSVERGETAAFGGWEGRVRLPLGHGEFALSSDQAQVLVLHRPPVGDYLCVEPVTRLPGMLGDGQALDGELAPGRSRTVSVRCTFHPA